MITHLGGSLGLKGTLSRRSTWRFRVLALLWLGASALSVPLVMYLMGTEFSDACSTEGCFPLPWRIPLLTTFWTGPLVLGMGSINAAVVLARSSIARPLTVILSFLLLLGVAGSIAAARLWGWSWFWRTRWLPAIVVADFSIALYGLRVMLSHRGRQQFDAYAHRL